MIRSAAWRFQSSPVLVEGRNPTPPRAVTPLHLWVPYWEFTQGQMVWGHAAAAWRDLDWERHPLRPLLLCWWHIAPSLWVKTAEPVTAEPIEVSILPGFHKHAERLDDHRTLLVERLQSQQQMVSYCCQGLEAVIRQALPGWLLERGLFT